MTKKIVLTVISLLCVAALLRIILLDEQVNCVIDNVWKGYVWNRDFGADVAVSRGAEEIKLDFSKLAQFRRICVVSMYDYGAPYTPSEQRIKLNGPKACWRETESTLTVAGLIEDGTPTWARISLTGPRQFYRISPRDCCDREEAVLTCRRGTCSFDQRTRLR